MFSRQKKNKMCAGIIFEQGLIHATFLVVHIHLHIYLIAGDKKNESLLDFRVKKKAIFTPYDTDN